MTVTINWLAAAFLSAAIAAPVSAQTALPLRPAIQAGSAREDPFPLVTATFPDEIVASPHVEYANYVGYRPLELDLYLHKDRAKAPAKPLIVWVHGGGWNRGDGRGSGAFADYPAVLAAMAARGYVVASVEYRLSGEARFPAAVQDVKAAIRFLRSKAGDYGIDPQRVILWGGSAGGHLASLAATTCGVPAFDPPASTGRLNRRDASAAKPLSQSDCVQGAVIWYGAFDFTSPEEADGGHSVALRDTVTQFLGCDRLKCSTAQDASPIHYVSKATPPMLLLAGTTDEEIGFQQSERMAAALKKAGVRAELVEIPDVGHGFIAKTPDGTRAAHFEALDRTLAFINDLTRH